ncbi:MAG: hypothetical protein ACRDV1_10205 [Actinomycetes bacterium]
MTEPSGYDEDVLPEQTSDDTDSGWGDAPVDDRDADERLLEDKPPHW